jgi:hypothetical protein
VSKTSTDAAGHTAYRAAIDRTAEIVAHRARNHRNQVAAVVVVGLAAVTSAAVARSPGRLALLLFLVPLCGAFLLVDARLLNEWRSALLARWADRELDLAAFRDAMRAHPTLPTGTLEAMLATLPAVGDLVAEQQVAEPNRRAIATVTRARQRQQVDALALRTAASAIVAVVAIEALWNGGWTAFRGLGTLGPLPVLAAALRWRRRVAHDEALGACRKDPAFSESDHARLLAGSR